jgi:hypothetical protein
MKLVNLMALVMVLVVSHQNVSHSQDEQDSPVADRASQGALSESVSPGQGKESDSSRVARLLRLVRDGENPTIRVQAIRSLRDLWDHDRFPEIFEVLFEVRNDPEPTVRDTVFLMFAEHQRVCCCTITAIRDTPFQPCAYRSIVKGTPLIAYERVRPTAARGTPTSQIGSEIPPGLPAFGNVGQHKPGELSSEELKTTQAGQAASGRTVPKTGATEPESGESQSHSGTTLVSLLKTVTDRVSDCTPGGSASSENHAFWEHQSSIVGDFLYLSPFGVDTLYGMAVDGFGASAVPTGSTAVADPVFQPGFRVGGSHRLSDVSSLTATFWHYESDSRGGLDLPGGSGFVRSEVVHPNTLNVASDGLAATANYGIDFQMVDVAYRKVLRHGDHYAINGSFGLRYANLDQDFGSTFSVLGTTTVDTEIDFDGLGPRIGLDAELELDDGWLLYGQGAANFLTGEFRGTYRQDNVLTGPLASVNVSDDRIVSQLELELGFGWRNQEGTLGIFSGYYLGSWLNTMTTSTLIDAVQTNDFDNMDETLGFGGLTVRVELRY